MQGTRLLNNFISGTDTRVQEYNKVFDELLHQFTAKAAGHTLVVVHRIWKRMEGFEALGNAPLNWTSPLLF